MNKNHLCYPLSKRLISHFTLCLSSCACSAKTGVVVDAAAVVAVVVVPVVPG